ncbi:MAG: hypothetical protein DSM106950_45215 [Stigonema ocellatum SAG 48.90 = DSM 106950]|nr:hypothetical protein [Stigonema ocellatum SAG 48.90 = DSM 106950]
MEQLCISGPIMALKRTLSEKLLLACVCQRAVHSHDQCADSNKELGQALALHPNTVSDLIGQLVEAGFIESIISQEQANRRHLIPQQQLLEAYRLTKSRLQVGGETNAPITAKEVLACSNQVTLPPATQQIADETLALLAKLAIVPTFVHASAEGSWLIEYATHDHYYLVEFYADGDIVFIERSAGGTKAWDLTGGTCTEINALMAPPIQRKLVKTWLTRCRQLTAFAAPEAVPAPQA